MARCGGHAAARRRRVARRLWEAAARRRGAGYRPRRSVGRTAALAAAECALTRLARGGSGTPFAAAGSAGQHVHQLALAFRGHVPALDRVR